MQHQYWITKKSVLRKLGGKEDECIVASDAELDAKLELFKSINDTCLKLQRVIDLYQERLCYLAQEEHALGRYLKECGKTEKNETGGKIMTTAGKALAYVGHQRLTVRPSLIRLHHELDTFRSRAISDTRLTITEMEKIRTEYRAALSWMKAASTELDPDSGHGLEKFRKAQSHVKSSKAKFDNFTLACLQKIDLLAAARCNMFSHSLVMYQNNLSTFTKKTFDTLSQATASIGDPNVLCMELTIPSLDKDKETFFNAEYTDAKEPKDLSHPNENANSEDSNNLLLDIFSDETTNANLSEPAETSNIDLLGSVHLDQVDSFLSSGDFMPSQLLNNVTNFDFSNEELVLLDDKMPSETKNVTEKEKVKVDKRKTEDNMNWLSLFAELDPLSNPNYKDLERNDTA